MKTFIDLSHLNDVESWAQIAQSGISGVILKATEGITGQDEKFLARVDWAKGVNLQVMGAYHFYHPSDDPTQQAGNFLKMLKLAPSVKTAVIDLEWTEIHSEWANVPEQKRYDDLHAFIELLEQEGYEVIIYTSHSFVTQYLPGAGFLGNYKLWVAWYEAGPPLLPHMWSSWWAWQYTAQGNIGGINGPVDISYLSAGEPSSPA